MQVGIAVTGCTKVLIGVCPGESAPKNSTRGEMSHDFPLVLTKTDAIVESVGATEMIDLTRARELSQLDKKSPKCAS